MRVNGEAPELQTAPLDAIGRAGFASLSSDELEGLIAGCANSCEQAGDARYCILRGVFAAVRDWRDEHDEAGGVPRRLLEEIGKRIDQGLPAVFSTSLAIGAQAAARLRDDVRSCLLSPQEWEAWS